MWMANTCIKGTKTKEQLIEKPNLEKKEFTLVLYKISPYISLLTRERELLLIVTWESLEEC
jgi:hypothetical protein